MAVSVTVAAAEVGRSIFAVYVMLVMTVMNAGGPEVQQLGVEVVVDISLAVVFVVVAVA